jgi:hypothetical protein
MKLIVGVVALTLAPVASFLAKTSLTSISASYWDEGPSHVIFIGFLFAIASFLLAYNGYSKREMIVSKVAAFAAVAIALFPCECDPPNRPPVPGVHFPAAATMFLILAFFCYLFYQCARAKGHSRADVRAAIYAICGVAIIVAIFALVIYAAKPDQLRPRFPRFVFYGEAAGLTAFGISWLVASRTLPVITKPDERFSPLTAHNPP